MFFLSWLTARGSGTGSVCLITETDSPADTSESGGLDQLTSVSADVSKNKAAPVSPTEGSTALWFILPHWSVTYKCLLSGANLKLCHDKTELVFLPAQIIKLIVIQLFLLFFKGRWRTDVWKVQCVVFWWEKLLIVINIRVFCLYYQCLSLCWGFLCCLFSCPAAEFLFHLLMCQSLMSDCLIVGFFSVSGFNFACLFQHFVNQS